MSPRLPLVDQARGLAVVAMVVYHFAWFAQEGGLVALGIGQSLGWHVFQRSIATTFFALVGVSLSLAGAPAVRWAPFLRRLGLVAGGALVVTATSLVLDPARVVRFGILHSIATCSVLALVALRLADLPLVMLGLALSLVGLFLRLPAFDTPWLHWTGLSPRQPPTFDIQPLLPWLGVVLIGGWLGRWLPQTSAAGAALPGAGGRLLGRLGRHSLLLYMAHVPVLVGIVALLRAWVLP
jgi:uncharacterized membrane protein